MATDTEVNMAERLEFDEVYYAEAGPYGTMGDVDPTDLWPDPTRSDLDDVLELMGLLQESREMNEQGACSIPGMPRVEPVRE